jgi:hypothetical protein
MSRLTSERRNQLAKAHDALNRGDHGLAAAYFFEDIEGFLERMSAVLKRTDLPTVARKPSAPKPPKPPKVIRAKTSREYAEKRRQAEAILTAIPDSSVSRLATQLGTSQHFILDVKKQMGLPPAVNGRALAKKILALLAECPQITNRAISIKLNCSTNYAATLRRQASNEDAREASGGAEQSQATSVAGKTLKPASEL